MVIVRPKVKEYGSVVDDVNVESAGPEIIVKEPMRKEGRKLLSNIFFSTFFI